MRDNRASWAAALALAVGVTSGASAADLGGNCCADLEERIAELEATTARKGNRKVSLEVSGWLNKSLLFWDDSIRSDVYAGIDNDAASSRWRFTGSARISPDVTAGFLYEFNTLLGLTSAVNQSNGGDDRGITSGAGQLQQSLRQANAWLESKRFGRVTIGLASQATDGIAEIDLSRTEAVSGSAVNSWMEGFASPVRIGGVASYTFPAGFHFLGNFDGARDQLVRYDSPTFGGFRFSASHSIHTDHPDAFLTGPPADTADWDVALRYAGEFNGFRFASGIGYHYGILKDTGAGSGAGGAIAPCPGVFCGFPLGYDNKRWGDNAHTIVGSSSLLHVPSGLFLSTAGGQLSFDDDSFLDGVKYQYIYVKGGILANLLPVGQTSIYGEYYGLRHEFSGGLIGHISPGGIAVLSSLGADFTSHVWGVGVVQHIDAAAMEVYLAYRYYDAPDYSAANFLGEAADFGDFHMVQAGARIRF